MSYDNYLAYYRGELQAIHCHGAWVVFVSKHYEGQATALYRFNLEEMQLHESALSCGATALAADNRTNALWLAAEDGYLYQTTITTGKPKALKKLPVFEQPIIAMTHLSEGCIAVLQANTLTLINTEQQKIQQQLSFSLRDSATVIASDATGTYLALGMQSGEVAVYEYREQQLHFSAKADLHQGKVTALQFEPHELRFFSAGEDKKLLSTHALGELEALDRGKKKNHTGVITAIVLGEKRFFTVASDKSAKSWAYEGGQPVSWQNNLHKAMAAGLVTLKDSRYLLIANSDNSLRVVGIDAEERFTALKHITRDGYAWARNELQQSDPVLREKAVRFLIHYDDKKAIDILKKHLAREQDKATRELIVTLATQAKHPHSITVLEDALCDHKHESIRRLAFAGLEKQAQAEDLGYLSLVLQYNYDDIGRLALTKLATLAKKQPRAEQLLLEALNHQQWCLREFALSVLETLYRKKDPKAGLQALKSRYADLQRAAMIRLFQRGLLDVIEVKRAIALLQDHQDALVRHTAFLVSILSQNKLATVLKAREKDLARQLQELEDFELLADQQQTKPSLTQKIKKKFVAQSTIKLSKLTHDDYEPLLQGMSSRHADICFTASFALAVLEDTRAFGVLLLLSHDRDTDIRVGVCKAFAWLQQDNSIATLQSLLHDSQAAVRDAAFSALQQVQQQPLKLATMGLAVEKNDIQLRALKALLECLKMTDQTDTSEKPNEALNLLKAALNSPFATIRQETFKACFNRLLGGDSLQTLHLLLHSDYEDIHQEVLNELTAASQAKQPAKWTLPLLQQLLLNNPFASIRQQAFELGIKQKKKFKPLTVLQAALASDFVDTRQRVLQQLISKPSHDNQALLLPLLNDADRHLRHQALSTLIAQPDSKAVLSHALESQYEDIRVAAAKASAALGDPQSYAILLSLVTQPKPEKAEDKKRWQEAVISALQGLALLGDARAFDVVADFLTSKDKALVHTAADVLPMINAVAHQAELQALLKNDTIKIRAAAALALAYTADSYNADIATALSDNKVKQQLSHTQLLTAQLCLAEVTPQVLQGFVVAEDTRISSQFILLATELLQHADKPVLSLQSLAVEEPRLQRMGADLLSRYHDTEQCWTYAVNWLNRSAGKESLHWAFTAEMLQQYSAIIVTAEPFIKVRFIALLQGWDQRVSMEQWQLSIAAFMARYKTAIPTYQAPKRLEVDAKQQRQWRELAFGAYLGRVRAEEGDAELAQRLQAASLRGMHYLAAQDQQLKPSV
jgi:ParB family chromosome partitioning protein